MANRVTAAEVKQILDTSLTDTVVDVFITAANLTITKILGTSTAYSAAQLKEIERWLSAHLIASTREQQAQREMAGDAEIIYQGKTGMGLDSTQYGQQVRILDAEGLIVAGIGKQRASITAVTSFS